MFKNRFSCRMRDTNRITESQIKRSWQLLGYSRLYRRHRRNQHRPPANAAKDVQTEVHKTFLLILFLGSPVWDADGTSWHVHIELSGTLPEYNSTKIDYYRVSI